MAESPSLQWSSKFNVMERATDAAKSLGGDKILLPQSALEQLLAAAASPYPSAAAATHHRPRPPPTFTAFDPYISSTAHGLDSSQQLPNPLMFRIVNPSNGNVVYAGIREFSADEQEVGLSPYLREALKLDVDPAVAKPRLVKSMSNGDSEHLLEDDDRPTVTVQSRQLPKGTYVRLRPLEAGYNPDDWKALLERQLRASFTTLTKNTVLSVRGVKGEHFKFLIDKFAPDGDGICVVDTDIEVDIEALNEEQARETLRRIAESSTPGAGGSSRGGEIDAWKSVAGQVLPGEYVDYELPSWDRSRPLSIKLFGIDGDNIDLLVSPKSSRQRALPRETEHVLGAFTPPRNGEKEILIRSANVELENCEKLLISVHAYRVANAGTPDPAERLQPLQYTLRVDAMVDAIADTDMDRDEGEMHPRNEQQCQNCLQLVPRRTMVLHENFCRRNNIVCPKCKGVFQKSSEEWLSHWHCPLDDSYGNSPSTERRHNEVYHVAYQCPACDLFVPSLVQLASHRTGVCPGKLILCQFCHLEVPQEGDPSNPSAASLFTGLTAHEIADGARTTECHLCDKIVRLRDMATHLKHHELDKSHRPAPIVCRNALCGRTLHGAGPRGAVNVLASRGQGPGNDLGLCSLCYTPLHASLHDPDGKALRRRIERRYLQQLMTGCGKSWCVNAWCRKGKTNLGLEAKGMSAQAALPIVKPLVTQIDDREEPMRFCADEAGQRRRRMAENMARENVFLFQWCIAALESEGGDLDAARAWLANWAPTR